MYLSTAHVSPQFHVQHDEFFETVNRGDDNNPWKIVAVFIDSDTIQQPKRLMLRKIVWEDQAPAEPPQAVKQNNDDQGNTEVNPDQN